jgi:hypothetical protein
LPGESVVKRKYRKKNNERADWHGVETEQWCLARPLLWTSPSKMLPTAKMAVGHLETRTIVMALNSVNTNSGALVALQNLNATNNELGVVQSRINTGKKVNSAKDNGAIWAIAQGQRSEISALGAVKDSLARGSSAVDVGLAAGESVSDLLSQTEGKGPGRDRQVAVDRFAQRPERGLQGHPRSDHHRGHQRQVQRRQPAGQLDGHRRLQGAVEHLGFDHQG